MANKSVGLLTIAFGADLRGFDRAMKKASRNIKRFGKNLQRTGQNLTRNITVPLIGLGAVSVKTFADFEQSMLKVKAVSGATGEEFKSLTDNARQLGSSTMFTASQVAELQFELAKLGFKTDDINNATQSILQLSQATGHELAESGAIVAATLNSFSMATTEAAHVADIFAFASSNAAIDMQKLSVAMPTVGATAAAVGIPLEKLTAQMMVLADRGMEASTMGTHLRKIFVELATKGIDYDRAMQMINNSTDKVKTATELFGKRAFAAGLILAENTIQVGEYDKQLGSATGTAKKMADIMDSGAQGAMRRFKSQLEGIAIEIGQILIPIFSQLMEKIQFLITEFNKMDKGEKKIALGFTLIAAAIGPALFVFGKLIIVLPKLIAFFFSWAGIITIAASGIYMLYRNLHMLTTQKFKASFFIALGKAMKMMGMLGGDALFNLGIEMAAFSTEDFEGDWVTIADVIKEASEAMAEFAGLDFGWGISESDTQHLTGGSSGKFIGPRTKEDSFSMLLPTATELENKILDLTAIYKSFGEAVQSSMEEAMMSQENFFKSFIENMKQALKRMLAMLATQMIMNALFAGTPIGKAMGMAKGGGMQNILDSVFPRTGKVPIPIPPTIPLGRMGNPNQQVEIFGRISGNDIFLSNQGAGGSRARGV